MAKCTYYLVLLLLLCVAVRRTLQLGRERDYPKCPTGVVFSSAAKRGDHGSRCALVRGDQSCNAGLRCCEDNNPSRPGLCYDPCEPNPCGAGTCSKSNEGSGYSCACDVPRSPICPDHMGKTSFILNGASNTEDNTNVYNVDDYDGTAFFLSVLSPVRGNDSSSSSIEANGWYLQPLFDGPAFYLLTPRICEPGRWCFEFAARHTSDLSATSVKSTAGDTIRDTRNFMLSSEFTVIETLKVELQCGQFLHFNLVGVSPPGTEPTEQELRATIDNVKLYAC